MPTLPSEFKLVSFTSEDLLLQPALQAALERFCLATEGDACPMARNYSLTGWQSAPQTLLHCLLLQKRFARERGNFWAFFDHTHIIAVSGIYRDQTNPEVAIAGVRAYTRPDYRYRFWHGDFIFPQQIVWAQSQEIPALFLTFNAETLNLSRLIERISQNKAVALGMPLSPAAHQAYHGFVRYPRQLMIQGVPQHVLYKTLRDHYEINFDLWTEAICAH